MSFEYCLSELNSPGSPVAPIPTTLATGADMSDGEGATYRGRLFLCASHYDANLLRRETMKEASVNRVTWN